MGETTALELASITSQNAVEIFTKNGLDAILDGVEAKVRAVSLDPSTGSGREVIRSLAYKIARTKTALDAEGKKLTEGWRTATALVNAERRKSTERLDALAEEVRKPLTDFEDKEKSRVAGHEEAIAEIVGIVSMLGKYPGMSLDNLLFQQSDLRHLHSGRDWQEFLLRAQSVRTEAEKYLSGRIEARKRFEVEQEELARLRKAEAERLQHERDEKLKADAAEKARVEEQRKAKEAADAEAKRVIEAAETERKRVEAKANLVRLENERQNRESEAARQKEEQAKFAAEKRAKDAEAATLAAQEKAARDLKESEARAKREAESAAQRERNRIEAENKASEAERQKREADEQLRLQVHLDIANDCAEKSANEIAAAIMNGKVRHVRVVF